MFVGIDDTDSKEGMCTTYLAALLCQKLNISGTPKLVRLNPNIPYKTRGNGAVSFMVPNSDVGKIVLSYVKKYAKIKDENTNPGVVFLDSNEIPHQLNDFYWRAVSELVTIEDAQDYKVF